MEDVKPGDSLKDYAAKVFHDSLVTGVPNIVKVSSWKWKILKMLILGLCLGGFLYQATTFLQYVFTYPSVVDIHVKTPKEFIYPAFTMCNNNGIKRSKFCDAHPEKCETPINRTEFCDQYRHYCNNITDWENFKVPKRKYYSFENSATFQELKEFGHSLEHLVQINGFSEASGSSDVEGPLLYFKNFQTGFLCYSLHSRVNSSLDPAVLQFGPLTGIPRMLLSFDFEPEETFYPGREPGGLLAIHSPFEMINPYDFGHPIQPGKIYKVHLKMEEEELLPYPYRSSCINYTEKWVQNGRKGPRSQEMCKQTCLMEEVLNSCNCSLKIINFPVSDDMCFSDDYSCISNSGAEEILKCIEDSCKDDCQKYKFQYFMEERAIEEIDSMTQSDGNDRYKAHAVIYTSDPEVVSYKYRPHYQNIEVFSYIGGYIGAWLGISLIAVADFFESLFRIAVFAIRKGNRNKDHAVSLQLENAKP